MSRNKIFFRPTEQIENAGDLLICKAELDLLRPFGTLIIDDRKIGDKVFNEIAQASTDKKLTSFSSKPLIETIEEELKKNNGAEKIFLFFEPGHTFRSGWRRAYHLLKVDSRYRKLTQRGLKICRIGFSIGPFDMWNALRESFSSRYYALYAVRDHKSIALAKKWGFKSPKYFPDLAFAYKADRVTDLPLTNKVVLSFRSNDRGKIHDESYLKKIADKLVKLLSAVGQDIHVVVSYQVAFDREPSMSLHKHLSPFFRCDLVDELLSVKSAEALYADARLVLSNRLHVVLLALQAGGFAMPYINQSGNVKITSIFSDNGLEEMLIDQDEAIEMQIDRLLKGVAQSDKLKRQFRLISDKNVAIISGELGRVFNQSS